MLKVTESNGKAVATYTRRALAGFTILALAVCLGFARMAANADAIKRTAYANCLGQARQYGTVVRAVTLAYAPVTEADLHLNYPLTPDQVEGLKEQNRINQERRDFVLKGLGPRPEC